MKNICLLDLNYTLVGNQADTRLLRPFARRFANQPGCWLRQASSSMGH